MRDNNDNPELPTLAAFTVCADPELSGMAHEASRRFPGIVFAGEFHDYITAKRRPHFPAAIKNARSSVAFVDFDRQSDQAVETVAALRDMPTARIISVGVSSRVDPGLLLRAMRAGCSEFLEKPIQAACFDQTLERLQNRMRSSFASPTNHGKIMSLFGAKGGVGVTTLAVHLAIYLQKQNGRKTLLIDQHHQLGHVCLYLGLKNFQYHFDDLIRSAEHLDADLMKGFVVSHGSGLDVLAAPDTCAVPYRGTREEIEQALEFLRYQYDYVVIDSSLAYGEATTAILESSDDVCLIAAPDVATVRDLSRHLDRLGEIASAGKHIILNRASPNDAVGAKQIEEAVRLPVAIRVPNSPAEIMRAINAGEPIPPGNRSSFATQIGKWAEQMGSDVEAESGPVNKKRFAFWR